MTEFSKFHPFVNLIYFVAVIGFSMFLMHPVCIAISVLCAVVVNIRKINLKNSLFLLSLAFFTAILNPLFNHRGESILWYFPSGNPLTFESLVFGVAAGGVLVASICWFSYMSKIITSEKVVFLFGTILPSLSLVVSMSLRFVPEIIASHKRIRLAQKAIGKFNDDGFLDKARCEMSVVSAVVSKSLEGAIETADSMKSRGFGTGKRTSYSVFLFGVRDLLLLLFIISICTFIIYGIMCEKLYFWYFPEISGAKFNVTHIFYAILCTLPIIIELWEGLKWKYLKSKI